MGSNVGPTFDTSALINMVAAAGAQTLVGNDQTNNFSRGVNVGVYLQSLTGGSVTIHIQGKDAASGQYYDILVSSAIVTTGFTLLTVYPGLVVAANAAANAVLPATWRVTAVLAAGVTVTGTVGASVIE